MSGQVIGANTALATDAPEFELLTEAKDKDGNAILYVQAAGAIDAQDFIHIDETGQATAAVLATGNLGDKGGVANTEFADNQYGWAQRSGVTTVNVAASAAADTVLNVTSTAGVLDDNNESGGEDVEGLWLNAADGGSGGAVSCRLNYPVLGATN